MLDICPFGMAGHATTSDAWNFSALYARRRPFRNPMNNDNEAEAAKKMPVLIAHMLELSD